MSNLRRALAAVAADLSKRSEESLDARDRSSDSRKRWGHERAANASADAARLIYAALRGDPEPEHEQRYPLWCADSGETDSELRYRGAFDSAADLEPLEPGETLRRCRRVQASELQRSLESAIAFMVEDIEDRASSGDLPDDAFADFDTAVVECADLTALRKAVESHLVVHAFVCEGDE